MIAPTPAADRWLHELRNQLGVILGFSELLLQEIDEADAKRPDIKEIHKAAERSLELLTHPPVAEEPGQ